MSEGGRLLSVVPDRPAFSTLAALDAALDAPDLAPGEKLVLLALIRRQKDGRCHPGTRDLMRLTGLSRTTVFAARRRLRDLGIITWDAGGSTRDGERHANDYLIRPPSDWCATRTSAPGEPVRHTHYLVRQADSTSAPGGPQGVKRRGSMKGSGHTASAAPSAVVDPVPSPTRSGGPQAPKRTPAAEAMGRGDVRAVVDAIAKALEEAHAGKGALSGRKFAPACGAVAELLKIATADEIIAACRTDTTSGVKFLRDRWLRPAAFDEAFRSHRMDGKGSSRDGLPGDRGRVGAAQGRAQGRVGGAYADDLNNLTRRAANPALPAADGGPIA